MSEAIHSSPCKMKWGTYGKDAKNSNAQVQVDENESKIGNGRKSGEDLGATRKQRN